MERITIKNIGPIKHIDINLNKVNVFMGPQSSGKSIIVKIVSFCRWVEKRFMLDGVFNYTVEDQLFKFHRLDKAYFNSDSEIIYESQAAIKISYIKNKLDLPEIETPPSNFKNTKNIFIPAERNFASVIPNLNRYAETNDNILNFLYDWFQAKKEYPSNMSFPILNLGVAYYNNSDINKDIIYIKENNQEINLNYASSGLQSITPLLILMDYISKSVYDKERVISVMEKERAALFKKALHSGKRLPDANELEDLMSNFTGYKFSRFIIEEAEQNLFPTTQRDLLYYLIQVVNNDTYNHNLSITTHSPYILYALNNCMMGHHIKIEMPEDEQQQLPGKASWIDPKLVSVWEIDAKQGTLRDIKNKNTGTVDKHYFNSIMNEIMDEYYEMLNYLDL